MTRRPSTKAAAADVIAPEPAPPLSPAGKKKAASTKAPDSSGPKSKSSSKTKVSASSRAAVRKKLMPGQENEGEEANATPSAVPVPAKSPRGKGKAKANRSNLPTTPSKDVASASSASATTPPDAKAARPATPPPSVAKEDKYFVPTRETGTSDAVKRTYKIVHKCTGSLGGNGAGGAIYGEQTLQSMQNVTEFMCLEGELGPDSIFIDIGAGLGKPNLHVALDPQVRFSVGIEHENVRWQLSLHNLKHVLASDVYSREAEDEGVAGAGGHVSHIGGELAPLVPPPPNCIFLEADAYDAKSFDPFTHVYMFDIGFPPNLFLHIAECLRNSSSAKWVLCYHGPKLMCNEYGFEMELVKQLATSMHGSGEGHTAYLYKCTHAKARQAAAKPAVRPTDAQVLRSSDPVWKGGLELLVEKDVGTLSDWVATQQAAGDERPKRTRKPPARLG